MRTRLPHPDNMWLETSAYTMAFRAAWRHGFNAEMSGLYAAYRRIGNTARDALRLAWLTYHGARS